MRVTAVGICGSDLHWFTEGSIGDSRVSSPLVLGHEAAGVIASGDRAGQLVAIDPAIPCYSCRQCRLGREHLCDNLRFAGHGGTDGAMRTLMAWPMRQLVPMPPDVDDLGALMLEPIGVAIHAFDLARTQIGASVGVYGCGPIGLLLVRLARLGGAGRIVATDTLPHRIEAALQAGATEVALVDRGHEREALRRVVPDGTDSAFEVAGEDDAVETAVALAAPATRVVLVGIPAGDRTSFPASLARRKGITFLVSRRMNHTYPTAIDLVSSGLIDVGSIVTDVFPFADYALAVAAAIERRGLKVVVRPALDPAW